MGQYGRTRCFLFLHDPVPPFAPRRQLLTAQNIDRVRPLSEPGSLTFQVAANEVNALEIAAVEESVREMTPTMAIVDRSTEDIAPWLWYIARLSDDLETGLVEVECREWRQLLYERKVPLGLTIRGGSAPAAALQLLRASGGRNPTYIQPSTSDAGAGRFALPPNEALVLGGLSVGAAFDGIADRTDSEWFLSYRVRWQRVTPTLHWTERRGSDLSANIIIDEGHEIASGGYTREIGIAVDQKVGGGGLPATRPAGAAVISSSQAARERPVSTGRLVNASENKRRKSLRDAPGPAEAAELVEVLPAETSPTGLEQAAVTSINVPVVAAESLDLILNHKGVDPQPVNTTPTPSSPAPPGWRRFEVGDSIRVRSHSARFGTGVSLVARVMAMQPDEGSGEMPLVLEVQ